MVILGFRPKKGCKIICRPPTIVGDQLRRGGKCAGLNPLSRTIQGNDPVQQLVLLVLANIGWHHCRTRNSISPHNWSTVMWPVPIGCWHRVSTAINNHQGRTQDPIGPRNWSIVMWLAPIGWWRRVSLAIYTTGTQDLGFFVVGSLLIVCWLVKHSVV